MGYILLGIISVLLCRWLNGKNAFPDVVAKETECENCGCCVGGACNSTFVKPWNRTVDGYCTNGCDPGYGGVRCYNKCPDGCKTCEHMTSLECITCDEGKYLNTDKQCADCPGNCLTCNSSTNCFGCKGSYYNTASSLSCSLKCSSRCKTCTSWGSCQECYPPYFNEESSTDCSLSCPGNCVCQTLGVCSYCKAGYYNVDNECRDACPDNCYTCSDLNNCQSCKIGYYNGQTEGKYQNVCSLNCSRGCKHDICELSSGDCQECKANFTGDKCCVEGGHCQNCSTGTVCERCAVGFFGFKCDKHCPSTCLNEGIQSGCTKTDGKCIKCDNGFYGDHCSKTCSVLCLNGRCLQDTGHCTDGCVGNFEGPFCMQEPADVRMVGLSVGLSTGVNIIIISVLVGVGMCLYKRQRKQKRDNNVPDVVYVNTESHSVSPGDVMVEVQPQQKYDDLEARNSAANTDYETI